MSYSKGKKERANEQKQKLTFLDEKRKLGLVKRIQKQITKFGLTNEEINFATN